MRYTEFTRTLVEADDQLKTVTKHDVEQTLRKAGYEDIKPKGNKLNILVQIPDGAKKAEFRSDILQEVLAILKKAYPHDGVEYTSDTRVSSLGGIIFANGPVQVVIKDSGGQGDQSAGIANEIELASIIQSVVEKYGSANVTFVDPRGKKMTIKNCINVDVAGRDTGNRKKADVVLQSPKGFLPISIKKLNADIDDLDGEETSDLKK